MSIGFLGTGAIGGAVAGLLARSGATDIVVSNSRGAASIKPLADRLGPAVTPGDATQAVACDLVFLSVPWSKVPSALANGTDWSGKILVDTTNPLEAPTFRKADLAGRTSSEVVASHAPGATVVKAFNHLQPDAYDSGPTVAGGRRLLFVSSDDTTAKQTILDLIAKTGFVGIDLGTLAAGGALHEFPGGVLPARNFIEI
ncbi:NADPH-dependent F420 reductase [Nocardioides sp. WG-D5]